MSLKSIRPFSKKSVLVYYAQAKVSENLRGKKKKVENGQVDLERLFGKFNPLWVCLDTTYFPEN